MTASPTAPGDGWRRTRDILRAAGIASPDLDARLLARAADGRAEGTRDAVLDGFVARRVAGEPVSRILGRRAFWTLELEITPDVLDPRPDTETVVEAALTERGAIPLHIAARVLDLGAGSGAILLALLAEWPNARGVGVDLSPGAVGVARRNAAANNLADRAGFEIGDFTRFDRGPFDIVVANPPYIATGDLAGLAREVRDHDPRLALDGGEDGLAAYRAILPRLPLLLAADGFAVLELGAGQHDAVSGLAAESGLRIGSCRSDLGGVPRALVVRSR